MKMKQPLPVVFLVISASAMAGSPSQASPGKLVLSGKYTFPHSVLVVYPDQKSCESDGGIWEDDACIFSTEDTIQISRQPGKPFRVVVNSVGRNGHACFFVSARTKRLGNTLVARESVNVYVPETSSQIKQDCILSFTFRKEGGSQVVDLTNGDQDFRGACASFCGANMSLEIFGAIKR